MALLAPMPMASTIDGDGREGGILPQHARSVPKVLPEGDHGRLDAAGGPPLALH